MRVKTLRIALIALIAVNLAFIYVNSMLPPAISGAGSGRVARFIATIFSEDSVIGGFLISNVRKIAHFVEFAALGAEIAVYVSFFSQDRAKGRRFSLLFGFFAAFADESVQMFSGRGPSISDVWLDCSGYYSLMLVAFFVIHTVRKNIISRNR